MVEEAIPFRPSNGSAGADFMERWCAKCARDSEFMEGTGESCIIAAMTMCFAADDPQYPQEWRQDGPLGPRCTAFEPIDPLEAPRCALTKDMFA